MSVEEMLCSLRPVESRRYDSPCSEVVFHFLPFRDRRRITSLPKMMKVFLFARVLFGLCCPFLAGLGQFVLQKSSQKGRCFLKCFSKSGTRPFFLKSLFKFFLNTWKAIAIFFMTQSLKISSLSSGKLKCHLTSAHSIFFSVSGTIPASLSVLLVFFHSLKLIGMFSRT